MDAHAERLRRWLEERRVDAQILTFAQSTHSVREAAAAAGAREEEFVKTILMVADDALVAAVVKGEDRASTTRVGQRVGAPARLARPEEMLARSGYPAGGTPPFGFEARFLVDERVMERAVVYAGGGSDRALVRVAPVEMLRANGGALARVRK